MRISMSRFGLLSAFIALIAMASAASASDSVAITSPTPQNNTNPTEKTGGEEVTIEGTFTAGGDGSDSIDLEITPNNSSTPVSTTSVTPAGTWSKKVTLPNPTTPGVYNYKITAKAKNGTVTKAVSESWYFFIVISGGP